MLRVWLSPDSFFLYDPVDVQVELVNTGSSELSFLSVRKDDVRLTLEGGAPNEVRLGTPRLTSGLQSIVTVPPSGKWRARYSLYDFVRFQRGGTFEFAYEVPLEVIRDPAKPHISQTTVARGTLLVEVKGRTGAEVGAILERISEDLEKKGDDPEVLRRLLPITVPAAIPVLRQGWSVFVEEEDRRRIVDALIELRSQEALEELRQLARTSNCEDLQLHIVSAVGSLADVPETLQGARGIWVEGLSVSSEDVRALCVVNLGTYCRENAGEMLRRMAEDPSEKVRAAVASALED